MSYRRLRHQPKKSLTAHQIVCLPLMIYFSYLGFTNWFGDENDNNNNNNNNTNIKFDSPEERLFGISDSGLQLGEMAFGMLLFWDIPIGFMTIALQDTLMAIHHIAMLFVAGTICGFFSYGQPIGSYFSNFYIGIIEFSTIFLSFVDIFHPKHKYWYNWLENSKGTVGNTIRTVNEVCRILFALSFLALRAVYFPYVMFSTQLSDFWYGIVMLRNNNEQHKTHGSLPPTWPLIGIFVLSFVFAFLQMYWGMLVAKGIAKAIGLIPSSDSDDEKEKDDDLPF